MKIDEITEKLKKLKSEIENAFEKELIDFDEIEKELSSVIDALQEGEIKRTAGDRFVAKTENYI